MVNKLELFHRSTLSFQKIAGETTGHPVAVFQRIDQAGYKQPIDERILADTMLMVSGSITFCPSRRRRPRKSPRCGERRKRQAPAARASS